MANTRVVTDELLMPLRDGTRLRSEVTRIDDGLRRPTLLMRTPYGGEFARAVHDPIMLARQGWAVVLQDVRGRWGSEGAFDAIGQEARDGAATIRWSARQPWCNGRVATIGASYNGFVQWAAATERPEGLCAISPSITTPFSGQPTPSSGAGWFGEGGAFRVGAWTRWALGIAAVGTGGSPAAERRAAKAAERWRDLARHPVNVDAIAKALPQFREWIDAENGSRSRPTRPLSRIDVPGYHLGGWYDIFCEGTVAGYSVLARDGQDERLRRSQRLVIGPWAHVVQFIQITGEIDYGPQANASARGIPQEQLSFLRDAAEGREPQGGVSVFVMGRNRWLDLDTWPPSSREVPLFLGAEAASNSLRGGGRLKWSRPEGSGVDCYHHDPQDPVPTLGGRHLLDGLPAAGPVDQRAIEARDDTLVYTTESLDSDLTVVGLVRAKIRFASTASQADVHVKLVDVHPDGRALNVVGSVRRVALTPGKPSLVEVEVGSTAMTFRRGHQIRIEVASSNWPHVDCVEAADQTVHWGGRSGSRLLLPVYDS